jgi:hypothetical protein
MQFDNRLLTLAFAALSISVLPRGADAQTGGGAEGWELVDRAMGRPGKAQPGQVQKYSFPRGDLRVTVGDVTVKPALALGSWVAFKRTTGAATVMAMGDLVLTEAEVPAVLAKLQEGGVHQTALHNHLQRERPRVMYLHIEGQGDPVKLAETIHTALAVTKTPPTAPAAQQPPPFSLDTAIVAKELGHGGTVNGGVYQVSIPRAEPVRMGGMEIPAAMGLATAINFQPTGARKSAVTGDFVLRAAEVDPVIRALRDGGITVTALHSHMLGEEPRLFFVHFWAHGDAMKLARALGAAVRQTNVRTAP